MRRAHAALALGVLMACGGTGSVMLPPGGASPASADGGATTDAGGVSIPNGPGGGGPSDGGTMKSVNAAGATDAPSSATSDGAPATGSGGPPTTFLPPVQGTCPTIATGTLTFAGQQVQIWAGAGASAKPGSLVLFWYGTGGSSADAVYLFGQTQIDAVTAAGGIVAAVSTSNKQGTDTGNGVWYTGDFDTADQVVACALQQKWIDPSRIYVTGDSAGGLQATWMAYARSGYLAAAAPLSGGLAGANGFYAAPTTSPQDPNNVPAALVTHGAAGVDVVVIDFAVASAAYEADVASKGGYSIDCNTGGGHVSGPPQICPAIWQFFEDHPFGVKQTYPSGLPSVFPSYCVTGPREADGGPV